MTSSFTDTVSSPSPLDTIADKILGAQHAAAGASSPASADTSAATAPGTTPEGPTFVSLGLSPAIVSALTAAGYKAPTPVQQRAIPAALEGRDLLVSSPTGSGKTAAFMLPAIERFAQLQHTQAAHPQPREPHAKNGASHERRARRPQPVARPGLLVLTPTRELAMQVSTAATTYGKHLRRLRTVSILGGVAYGQQLMLLAKNPEIIVATPGRLLDHLERGRIDLSGLQMLVLDEADRMLDMGFIDDIETIVAATPATRQTMLFSATLDSKIGALTRSLLNDPVRIEIAHQIEARSNIAQTVHYVDDRAHKDRLLDHLLRDATLDQAIVFTATKLDADQLANQLADAGFQTAALHGDLPQGMRNRTLRALREHRVRVLVATDVAARGIDVPGITHVFNYDLPKFAEDYVHRIGRTGRAGRSGKAVSLVHHAERGTLKRIERFVRTPLPVNVIEGFEPRKAPPPSKSRGGGFGRGRTGETRGRNGSGNGGRHYGKLGGHASSNPHRDSYGYGNSSNSAGAGNSSSGKARSDDWRGRSAAGGNGSSGNDGARFGQRKSDGRSRNGNYNLHRSDNVRSSRRHDG